MDLMPVQLASVREAVAAAALEAGRNPAEITLIGVTKRKPVAAIEAAFAASTIFYCF